MTTPIELLVFALRSIGMSGKLLPDDLRTLAQTCGFAVTPDTLAPINQDCAHALPDLLRSNGKLAGLVSRIVIHADRVDIALAPGGIARLFGMPVLPDQQQTIVHSTSVRFTRTGRVVRLVHDNGVPVLQQADPSLVRLILKARRWWGELAKGESTVQDLADREQVSSSYITRVVRLAFLAPDVVEAVLVGTVRAEVDGVALVRTGAVPASWEEQRGRFLQRSDR